MPVFTVHHTTTYRYRNPVGFGEHLLMLRPGESDDQRLLDSAVTITPEPASLDWRQDEFANWVGRARFRGRAKTLRFDAVMRVEQTPWPPEDNQICDLWSSSPGTGEVSRTASFHMQSPCLAAEDTATEFPDPLDETDIRAFLPRRTCLAADAVAEWARTLQLASGSDGHFATLAAMTRAIHTGFTYKRREEKGVQRPAETLALRAGSCRDLAYLAIDAARALGMPARFVSGYLHIPARSGQHYRGGGSTHAWLQAWLPERGWVDFDPTNGIIGNRSLIRVAAAPEPAQVLPLSGTFIGFPSDALAMEVAVHVTAEEGERRACGLVI